ncbi:hypothetical protein [Vibrio scophthalmi]|uniref:Uncharacterized protein n=1 Tax=Vibrio scophthalmi TaxID=45658 RepID=A0A1C7FIZ0_9VIBR|nr:hypothetical protein [Vibrio scophthalmi]ANU39423.1 hypothetical protein VSVS05_04388 [Vibrio scophthalmi]
MTGQTKLNIAEQEAQYQRELDVYDTVLWSTARMLNYFAWDEEKALKVMDTIYAKARSWPERFPHLVDKEDHNVVKATSYYYDILADAEPIVAAKRQQELNALKEQLNMVPFSWLRHPRLKRVILWLNRPIAA